MSVAASAAASEEDPDDRERRLDAAYADFARAVEQGREPDLKAWQERFPDLAAELAGAIEGALLVRRLAPGVADRPAPAEGARFGRYTLRAILGRGGMGVVYEAEDARTGAVVALKLLESRARLDPGGRRRFRLEVETLRGLDHPQILPLLDHGEADGIPFVTMPRVDGADVRMVRRALWRPEGVGAVPTRVAHPDRPCALADLALDADRPRAVALAGLQAARALAHAHAQGIVHRDVKPSNLLLDTVGRVFLTDFGLAWSPGRAPDLTATGDLAGTLRYLAPERLRGHCDERADVYGLGLTLHELLVRRPVFEPYAGERLLRAIACEAPPRPRKSVPGLPRALETIILRAIEKEPAHRHESARVMAEDLERFLDGRPIVGRRVGPLARLAAWARRERRMAAALAGLAAGLLAVGALLLAIRVEGVRAAARASRFETLLLEIERARREPRSEGWSARAWALVVEANALKPGDARLRDQAAAVLGGLDAHSIEGRGAIAVAASALAFDARGERLLIGGYTPRAPAARSARGRLWDQRANQVDDAGLAGSGPVAFDRAGAPLQLVAAAPSRVVLWDLARRAAVRTFDVPPPGGTGAQALASDGGQVAVASGDAVWVWDVGNEGPPRRFDGPATALAFAPDGSRLAIGEEAGGLRVEDLGGTRPAVVLPSQRNAVQALRFARDPRMRPDGASGWLLAAGHHGGGLVVWDLESGQIRARCLGALYEVTTLEFSPDGALLASGGRYEVVLWDATTGRRVLGLKADYVDGLAFGDDGRTLTAAVGAEVDLGRVVTWALDDGRSIRTLRGLAGPVADVVIGRDGRRVAALTQEWTIAVWDRASGTLIGTIDAPQGYYADNAALALSRDGDQLAVSTGEEIQQWDLASRRRVGRWRLGPGLQDCLVPDDAGGWVSVRAETRTGARPFETDAREHPRVVRARRLNPPEAIGPICEIAVGDRRVVRLVLDPDARWVAASSAGASPDGPCRRLRFLDLPSGVERWGASTTHSGGFDYLETDPTGRWLFAGPDGLGGPERSASRWEFPSGRVTRNGFAMPAALDPDAALLAGGSSEAPEGLVLTDGSGTRLVRLAIDDGRPSPFAVVMGRDGRTLAFGLADGRVQVADLESLRARLAALGREGTDPQRSPR